jgi:hypothetical protein
VYGGTIIAMSNGNYVVASPQWNNGRGAATWGIGESGVRGFVLGSNSLIGTAPTDHVGNGVTALTNGNYVVCSSLDGLGADTWGNGATGSLGEVSPANSLVGARARAKGLAALLH